MAEHDAATGSEPQKKPAAKKSPAKKPVAKAPSAGKASPAKKPVSKKPVASEAAPAKEDAPAASAGSKEKASRPVVKTKKMTGWDFATWRTASDDPVMRSTIIGLLVLDSAPDWQTLVERFDRASRVATVLREKVVEGPFGFEHPRVIIDPNFDLSFHLRRFRMPAHSTWTDVLDDARRQSMTDFDKDRPLWRVTLLEGLPGGKAALLIKLHHAIADGQGAVMLGAALFDFTPEGQDLGPMPPEPVGEPLGQAGFVDAAVRDNLGWVARSASDVIRGIGPLTVAAMKDPSEALNRIMRTAGSVLRMTKVPLGPMSPLMTARSINYHFDTFDLPFSAIKETAKANGQTANDVFLAAIASGLGEYHRRLGKPVDNLRVNMPISLRKPGQGAENAVTIARFELPVSDPDPIAVMKHVGTTVKRFRKEPALALADELAEVSRLIPPELISAVAQASDLTASNVPGVPVPVWMGGAQVLSMYPLVATIGAAVNVTMLTYNGTASVGVSTDDAAVDDREELVRCLRAGFRTVTGKPVPTGTPLTVRRPKRAK